MHTSAGRVQKIAFFAHVEKKEGYRLRALGLAMVRSEMLRRVLFHLMKQLA